MKNKKLLSALAAAGLMASGVALAANQGTMGVSVGATPASSQGDLLVTLQVPDMIVIKGLTDLVLNTGNSFTASDNVCVFRNFGGGYNVTASSGNDGAGAGAFTLSDGAGSTVTYSVSWDGTALAEDTVLAGQVTTTTTDYACGTEDIPLVVSTTAAAVANATSSTDHTDTLTLIVAAE